VHQITMAIPQLFQAGSSPAEKSAIRQAIEKCMQTLKKLDSRTSVKQSGDSQLVFALPHVFQPGSDLGENAAALEPLLECLCDIDLAYRVSHPNRVFLYDSPVYYERTVVWDSTPALYARGYGDCKSLTATRVSEYRAAGQEARPVFRFLPPDQTPKGQFQYHILVLGPYGWEDPSKIKGMSKNEAAYFQASTYGAAS
jgi:hypothetical protein